MHVSIIPKIEQLVRRKAESGLYRDPSGLIREAHRIWHVWLGVNLQCGDGNLRLFTVWPTSIWK